MIVTLLGWWPHVGFFPVGPKPNMSRNLVISHTCLLAVLFSVGGWGQGFPLRGGTQYYGGHSPPYLSPPPWTLSPPWEIFSRCAGYLHVYNSLIYGIFLLMLCYKMFFKLNICLQITNKYTILFNPIVVMFHAAFPPPTWPSPPPKGGDHSPPLAENWIGNPDPWVGGDHPWDGRWPSIAVVTLC